MAFYSDVQPGDKFTPNANLSNDVRHWMNTLNGFGGSGTGGAFSGVIRIQVYNSSGKVIAPKTAVNFPEGAKMCGEAIPCTPLTSTDKPWGILPSALQPGELGDCIISGKATVILSGTSGNCAKPSKSSPDVFTRGNEGVPILYAQNGTGIVMLAASAEKETNFPFRIVVDDENLSVIDGGNPDSTLCGTVYLNGTSFSVPKHVEAAPVVESYIYIRYTRYRYANSGDYESGLTSEQEIALREEIYQLNNQITTYSNVIYQQTSLIADKRSLITGKQKIIETKLSLIANGGTEAYIKRLNDEIKTLNTEINTLNNEIFTARGIIVSNTYTMNQLRNQWGSKNFQLYGTVPASAVTEIFVSPVALDATSEYSYYLIGTVAIKDGTPVVTQGLKTYPQWLLTGVGCE